MRLSQFESLELARIAREAGLSITDYTRDTALFELAIIDKLKRLQYLEIAYDAREINLTKAVEEIKEIRGWLEKISSILNKKESYILTLLKEIQKSQEHFAEKVSNLR